MYRMVHIKVTKQMISGSTEAMYCGPLPRHEAEEKISAWESNYLGLTTYPVPASDETGKRSYEIVEEPPAGTTEYQRQ
jgi:hypothetical protein